MYILKGFAQIGSLIDNTLTVVAPIGELTPLGMTFSREKTFHSSTDHPGIELVSFTSTQDNVPVTPDSTYTIKVLEVLRWVYIQSASGHFNQNRDNFQSQLLANFGGQIELLDSGLMTRGNSMWCPSYIDISFTADGSDENRTKVWFAGEAFVNEFDDFEILVVPPVENIDDFFNGYTQVRTMVNGVKLPEFMEKVQLVKDGYPDTTVVTNEFDWIDRTNRNLKYAVNWTVVVYGGAGDNLDSIKEAIVQFVLANSAKPREDWEVIFPDIFTATEFIITPMWNHYSVPNRTLEQGLYSPSIPVSDARAITKITSKGANYSDEHVDTVLQIVANPYKSVSLAVVGGPNNRDNRNKFNRQFPDYLSVPSTHLDFQRMSNGTRAFVTSLANMLRHAETLSPTSAIPREHTRTVRDGILYLSKTIDRVQYLVTTKYTLNDPSTGIPDLLLDGDGYTLTDDEGVLVSEV
jgi:hypothetical protein